MEEVLVAENVRRSYGDTVALTDVSLTLGEGRSWRSSAEQGQ